MQAPGLPLRRANGAQAGVMNTNRPAAGLRNADRDVSWMEETFPLHEDLIQDAIEQLAAENARARLTHGNQVQAMSVQRGALHARVTGPIDGYYVAAYACPTGNRGQTFVGEYKICEALPDSYWSAQPMLAGSCRHSENTGSGAMQQAEALAAACIARLRLAPPDVLL